MNDEITVVDTRCLNCKRELPNQVVCGELHITAVCDHCGWVAPIDLLEFLAPNDKTGYTDVVLIWMKKGRKKSTEVGAFRWRNSLL